MFYSFLYFFPRRKKLKLYKKLIQKIKLYKSINQSTNQSIRMICNICCDSFNKSTKIPIKCQFCDFTACRKCTETYLMQDTVSETKCMNTSCDKVWSYDFLVNNMTKVFLNTVYREKEENKLFMREETFMPMTQLEIEKDIKIEKKEAEITEKLAEMAKLKSEIDQLREDANNLKYSSVTVPKKQTTKIRGCPAENCRGYLSAEWSCGLCKSDVCSRCNEVKKDADHTCNEETVQTIKLMEKDCKNCPKCRSLIYKINGCDQMFCTSCHAVFSWNTLEINNPNTRVHNPHYYEWLRNNAPNGEIPREEEVVARTQACVPILPPTTHLFYHVRKHTPKYAKWFMETYRLIMHTLEVTARQFVYVTDIDINKNMNIRKQYLRNSISKSIFVSNLIRDEKKRKCDNDYNQLFQLFGTICTDLLIVFYRNVTVTEDPPKELIIGELIVFDREIQLLVNFFNASSENIRVKYGYKKIVGINIPAIGVK